MAEDKDSCITLREYVDLQLVSHQLKHEGEQKALELAAKFVEKRILDLEESNKDLTNALSNAQGRVTAMVGVAVFIGLLGALAGAIAIFK